ncbi:MAG: hypothetical protein HYT78_16425 [Deltaproteobacteria bacterium]|nr:hypothetical protein [Deltaproteobacteria bacterium]
MPFPTGTSEITEDDVEEVTSRFDELYEKAYGRGSGYREAGKEILTFRVTAVGVLKKPKIQSASMNKGANPDVAVKGTREVYFEERKDFVSTNIYDFERLAPGIIETPVTTIVVNPNDRAMIDEFLNVRILAGA